MRYYDIRKNETIIIEDGCAIVYDAEGYSKVIINVTGSDEEKMIEMLEENDERYELF